MMILALDLGKFKTVACIQADVMGAQANNSRGTHGSNVALFVSIRAFRGCRLRWERIAQQKTPPAAQETRTSVHRGQHALNRSVTTENTEFTEPVAENDPADHMTVSHLQHPVRLVVIVETVKQTTETLCKQNQNCCASGLNSPHLHAASETCRGATAFPAIQ